MTSRTATVVHRTTVMLGIAAVVALGACSKQQATAPAEVEAPSTDFIAENPTEPAVPVNLPTTAMTNVPAGEAAPASSASPTK
ncbi:hypothetical protein ACFFF7_05095 [Novosphingobium aquiterrae]|uniref:Uncharacterized protein n=1 Tax=Novosphingobium aquiterrae TaxID=624388 RepID=A0ABV6PG17_9SPHN